MKSFNNDKNKINKKKNIYHLKYIILLLLIIVILIEFYIPTKRFILSKLYYKKCLKLAKQKNKKLLVIGDPCGGNIMFGSPYEHGDITIDLFGCSKSNKIDINNINEWKKLKSNNFIVFETGTLSFSNDINKILKEIRRISGGEFYSSGGMNSFLWKLIGHKLYSINYNNKINYAIYSYTPKDKHYKVYSFKHNKYEYINMNI